MSDLSGFSMMELFKTEVENQAAVLSDGLLALESGGGAPEMMEGMMRAAHSVKGAARIVACDPAVELAHAMEDCFVAAQSGELSLPPASVDALLRSVDLLIEISQTPDGAVGDWLERERGRYDAALDGLKNVLSGETPSTAAIPVEDSVPEPPAEKSVGVADKAVVESRQFVRVSAKNMELMLDYAGENLVQSGWFPSFGDELLRLSSNLNEGRLLLEKMREARAVGDKGLIDDLLAAMVDNQKGIRDELARMRGDYEAAHRRMSVAANRLYREVVAGKMRPFGDCAAGFPRMVRDLSRSLGRETRFELIGADKAVDRDILEGLEAPLTHLLRNAVDHGIEPPAARSAGGKPKVGSIRMEAKHVAGNLVVEVRDDGGGVDLKALRAKIIDRGLSTPEMVAAMTDDELLEFLFLPGFSTKREVTETSGRGVGLDVLRDMLRKVNGTVRIESEFGRGTVFTMRLPLTLSVIRALVVDIGGEQYAVPLYRVERCLMVDFADINQSQDRQFVVLDGRNVGIVSACQLLEFEDESPGADEPANILVVGDGADFYGLRVGSFIGERDLVVRPLDPRLGKVRDVAAAAVGDCGEPLLILDVDDLIRSADSLAASGRLRKVGGSGDGDSSGAAKRVLVVDDSITVREVQRRLLESRGYQVDTAVNGIDGLNALRTGSYDLVVSDVDMPRMNGIDFVRRIRSEAATASLPVMIVSYKDRKEDRLAGMDAGANYYLTKSSFHDDSFIEAVDGLTGGAFE